VSPEAGAQALRLQRVARRWPRFAWDYRGLARQVSFDESYWTAVLAIALLLTTAWLDVQIWRKGAEPLPLLGNLDPSLLAVLLVVNGWVIDRLLTARTSTDRRMVPWVRTIRVLLSSIPILGLAVFPLWQRLLQSSPAWAFVPRKTAPLALDRHLPTRLGPVAFRTWLDTKLRAWSQRLPFQIAWLLGCQLAPWFSGLYLLTQKGTASAVTVCALLHLAAAGAGLAHAAVRSSLLQMTPGRTWAFRLLPLGLLLPFPLSFLFLLLWLPASEDTKEDKGLLQTLYRTRAGRRHPLAAARRPPLATITGASEERRGQAAAAKLLLLVLEGAALSWFVEAELFRLLLLALGFLGAIATFLRSMGTFLLSLFFGRPERPYTGQILLLVLFLLLAFLALTPPPAVPWLIAFIALVSPAVGIESARRWLAPLRLADLKNPRLPRPLRRRLVLMAITAILPLGGLALPWWTVVRRRYGSETARQAARLREAAA